MMDTLRIALGLALPWLLGYAWVRALRGRDASNGWVDWGYAHFVGVLLLTLAMRGVGHAGLALSLPVLVPVLALLTLAGAAVAWHRGHRVPVATTPGDGTRPVSTGRDPLDLRWLAYVAAALLAWHFGTMIVEVALRPLFPWDAWTQWGTKARVWSGLHALAPFIDWQQWLAGAAGYTDNAPNYPATVPLLQTWMALALGRFDDATINLPWLAAAVALAMAIYGQLRRIGVGGAWALFATYAVLSLPLADTHVALAGYADFHVAAAFALAVAALAAWEAHRDRYALALTIAMACLLPLLKVPGLAWGAIVIVGLLVAAFRGSWKRLAGVVMVTAVAATAIAALVWREKMASVTAGPPAGVLGSLVDNLFVFDNWHLLWYLLPIVVWIARRQLGAHLRGAGAALAAGGAFLMFVLAGTNVANWVNDYTTVNRAILHIAPAAAAFGALLLWHWAQAHGPTQEPATVAPGADSVASAAAAVAQQAVEVGDRPAETVAQPDGRGPAE